MFSYGSTISRTISLHSLITQAEQFWERPRHQPPMFSLSMNGAVNGRERQFNGKLNPGSGGVNVIQDDGIWKLAFYCSYERR